MSTITHFILIDDDFWNNHICSFNIKKALGQVVVHSFQSAEKGLAFIEQEFIKDIQPTILFLDINMPSMNGWQFLEKFANFSNEIKNNITIYMLSSSIHYNDIEKAKANKYVKDFISKPLLHNAILMVANNNITTQLYNL